MRKEDVNFDFWNSINTKFDDYQEAQFFRYYQLIYEYNQVMNLTGIDDLQGVYEYHFYDSLMISKYLDRWQPKTVADVGSGAGFPGIVLAIAYPEIKFILIESLGKRCKFLEVVVAELKLENVEILNKRAEEIKDKYDLVVSRAVAALNILVELTIPLTVVKGHVIAFKGSQYEKEIIASKKALKELKSEVLEVDEYVLATDDVKRGNIVIEKLEDNNKYPRPYAQIRKKPLGGR